MKKITIAFSAILLFISFACQNNNELSSLKTSEIQKEEQKLFDRDKPDTNTVSDFQPVETEAEPPQKDQTKNGQQQAVTKNPDWDKKIIKTAVLNLEIKDFKKYNAGFRDKVKQVGGYIAQEQQSETEYKIENTLTIKVPVDQFDDAVQLLVNDAEKLNEKKITSEDVTTEFVDTRSRLESKKQVRLRYLDLLKQAKNMEEILNVQSEVNGIQEEIEAASGRIEYLSHSSSFSTINLTYYQVLNAAAVDNDKPSFSTRISNAFRFGWNWVGELAVAIISIWPLLLAVFAIIIFYRRSNRAKPKQA